MSQNDLNLPHSGGVGRESEAASTTHDRTESTGGFMTGRESSASTLTQPSEPPSRLRKMLYVSAVFASLLGTPWFLGLLYLPGEEWTVIFAYLFVLFSAFQVFFFHSLIISFIFPCLRSVPIRRTRKRHARIRHAWIAKSTLGQTDIQVDANCAFKQQP